MNNSKQTIGSLSLGQGIITEHARLLARYDVALSVLGWESRALTALPVLAQRADRVDLIEFHSGNDAVKSSKLSHRKIAVDLHGERIRINEFPSSTDYDLAFERLKDLFWSKYLSEGQPLTVLLDMSCLPKRYLIFLLGLGFRENLFAHIDILYSEPEYYIPSPKPNPLSGLIAAGDWKSVQIPYFEGNDFVAREKDLFLAVGPEIIQAVPFIERFEPRKVRLYQIDNTENRVPELHLNSEKKALSSLFSAYPTAEWAPFHLEDVYGLAKDVLANIQGPTTCLAVGSKTQALAFCLAGLYDESIEIVCRNPGNYLYTDVTSTGRIFNFSLQDRFEPRIYLERQKYLEAA